MTTKIKHIIFFLIITFAAFGSEELWRGHFPDAELLFSYDATLPVHDIASDTAGNIYILCSDSDSVYIHVISRDGNLSRDVSTPLGPTPNPQLLYIEVSRDGKTVLVCGQDIELKTPINYVLDEAGNDILPEDNVLKYAEWLQLSPSGNYFVSQGFDGLPTIQSIFNRNWEEVPLPYGKIDAGYFLDSSPEGQDLLLATESDSIGKLLSLIELPSAAEPAETVEYAFKQYLPSDHNDIVPNRMFVCMCNDYIIITNPPSRSGTINGFERENGKFSWYLGAADLTYGIIKATSSFDGEMACFIGRWCIQILKENGVELSNLCEPVYDLSKPFFQPGVPNVSLWNDRRVLSVALYIPWYVKPIRTILLGFDKDWNAYSPQELPYRIEGFYIHGEYLLAEVQGSKVNLYLLPEN